MQIGCVLVVYFFCVFSDFCGAWDFLEDID